MVGSKSRGRGSKPAMARPVFLGRRVVLTGATSGIGWCLATGLIGAGASVVVGGRREDRLRSLKRSLGNPRELICIPGDVCNGAHREELVQAASERLGGLDVLINNAGVGAIGMFEHSDPQRLRQIFEVDFFAGVELTRQAIPLLKMGVTPAICNINSVLGFRGVPLKSEYCAAKFALRGWSESLRVELRPSGIEVVNVYPSTTKTEFFGSLIESRGNVRIRSLSAQSPETVARHTLRALQKGRRETILSAGGKSFVWFSRRFPRLADRLLQRFAMT